MSDIGMTAVEVSSAGGKSYTFQVKHTHPALPLSVVGEIAHKSQIKGHNLKDVLHQHHCKLYSHLQNEPEHWINGTSKETQLECMRSILSTYILRHTIHEYQGKGIDFKHHLYVAEESTKEDHGHLLKRCTTSARSGLVPDCDMTKWVEGLNDESTGLILGVIRGVRKQSVHDCEAMFSRGVIDYMEKHGHTSEAKFATIMYNWHKACDGRGISQELRVKYTQDMLDYILDDWMLWHRHTKDYSLVDINRPIKGICGFTRESLIGIIANAECTIRRYQMCETHNMDPEHPRSTMTDNVESIIATLHYILGPIFDHHTLRGALRKILLDNQKRISGTPFYYYTQENERFTIGPLPGFDVPSGKTERLDRTRMRQFGNPASEVTGRASKPVSGARTLRDEYHKAKDPLPNVPK